MKPLSTAMKKMTIAITITMTTAMMIGSEMISIVAIMRTIRCGADGQCHEQPHQPHAHQAAGDEQAGIRPACADRAGWQIPAEDTDVASCDWIRRSIQKI